MSTRDHVDTLLVSAHSIALIMTLAALVHSSPLIACSCVLPEHFDPASSTGAAAAVFVGRVVKISPFPAPRAREAGPFYDDREVVIEVSASWKGPRTLRITVLTGNSGADCGYFFETGKEYLVFADSTDSAVDPRWAGSHLLSVSLCSETSSLDRAKDNVRALRAWKRPRKPQRR
jgi:hypothetical protein